MEEKCTLADLEKIQEIGRKTYEPYYQHIWHPGGVDWYMDYCFNTELLKNELNSPNVAYFLPKDGEGAIMGLLKIWPEKKVSGTDLENALYLEKIYLLPAYFGQGKGQQIIEKVLDYAVQLGRESVWLTVLRSGPIKSYEKAGFEIIGTIDYGFHQLLEAERIGWVMEKKLQSTKK